MPFGAALSTAAETSRAVQEVCERAREQLRGTPDLALVFFSPHHLESVAAIAWQVQEFGARCVLACPGEAIVGNDQEIERRPALSLWLGSWSAGGEAQVG